MRAIVEYTDISGSCGPDKRLNLVSRETVRRHLDRTFVTRVLSVIDLTLGLGYWWFPKFEYINLRPDGTTSSKFIVRQTLAGYTIAWGHHIEFYEDGRKAYEGDVWSSAGSGKCMQRKHRYWLPNGTKVSQTEWMREMLGPEVDGCHDLAWEK